MLHEKLSIMESTVEEKVAAVNKANWKVEMRQKIRKRNLLSVENEESKYNMDLEVN